MSPPTIDIQFIHNYGVFSSQTNTTQKVEQSMGK